MVEYSTLNHLQLKLVCLEGEWLPQVGVQVPGLVGEEQQATQGRRQVVLAWGAYRATAAMEDLVLERLAPCFSCLSSDPHGSPLNPWMVARS
jgi:hypothetical protein